MKFKPNQTRTYDREGFKKRAACLCFRSEQEDEFQPQKLALTEWFSSPLSKNVNLGSGIAVCTECCW